MTKVDFNNNWICYETGKKEAAFAVSLPYDAMLLDEKSPDSAGGVNIGWYVPKDYTFEKEFTVDAEWEDQTHILCFEGVYHNATVYVNGQMVARHDYGYTGFEVELDPFLHYGTMNTLTVQVINSDQPNSRWYTGTGIYRPVWLYRMPKSHILTNGIKIRTASIDPPTAEIMVMATEPAEVELSIPDLSVSVKGQTNEPISVVAENAGLWSPKEPNLYEVTVRYKEDVRSETFGFRKIGYDAKHGLTINGERIILKGACIHHDNGLLGACAYDFAEHRKIRILKENGYNAIRSAHNPCSKALLRACDELGMLVMDEYVDMWYIHKTKYDYADQVEKNYRTDLKAIVDKDYNHPSVILYSTGNEVSETAQKRGIELTGEMTKYLHELDPDRPVSCGINIFFNFLSSMGLGVYSDEKAEAEANHKKKKKAVGSEFFNNLAGVLGAGFMKFGATLPPCDTKTKDAYANMDIAGYNYGIDRYKKDLKKYPDRLILGSETFCSDAYRFMEIAKNEPRIIGDFVWSGMDYLGECGIGSFEYKDYAPDFSHGIGWVAAGAGRIDLTGKPLSEADYTRVAFGDLDIAIGVIPVKYAKEAHSPSSWKMTNAMASWAWEGYEGVSTKVEVYARAASVELFLNQKSLGKKYLKKGCRVIFDVTYEPGELTAKAYDECGGVIAQTSLKSAKKETKLLAVPEDRVIDKKDGLAYIRFSFTDEEGTLKPFIRAEIKANVTGGRLIGFGSACPYYTKSYQSDVADTYYGEALAIVKPNGPGQICISANSRYGAAEATVEVR